MKAMKLVAGVVVGLGLGMVVSAQAQTVFKIGWTNTIDSHYGVGVTTFGDEIAKRTSGRYKLQYFPSGALGGERGGCAVARHDPGLNGGHRATASRNRAVRASRWIGRGRRCR